MAEKWIANAIKKKGSLRKSLHVKKGENISASKLNKALKSKNTTTVHRANLAKTLRGLRK